MANSNFLPGINTILNEAGLKVGQPPAGPKVTILGITSNTGIALRDPMSVSNVEKAITSLYFSGESGASYPGEMSLAIEEAVSAGAEHIEICVIAHKSGIALSGYTHPTGDWSARATDLSGGYDVLKTRDLDVVVPAGVYIDYTGHQTTTMKNFGKQLADFCFQATTDQNSCHGVIPVFPPVMWALHQGRNKFTGTVYDEVNNYSGTPWKSMRFDTPSTDLVDQWVNYHTDALVAADFGSLPTYSDAYKNRMSGTYNDSHNKFADAANTATLDTAYLTSWQATDVDGNLATDSKGNKIDVGMYLSVPAVLIKSNSTQAKALAGAHDAPPSNTAYVSDGAASYAGLINTLAPQSATTNKFVGGVFPLRDLARSQANRLVGFRNVTMYRRSKGFVVAKDITSAHNVNKFTRSDYTLLTTLRITETAVDGIRAIAENYLGEANNAARINALDNEINGFLLGMKGSALRAFDFVISSTPEERVLGQLNIDLTLVPAFEITDINLTVSLAKEL